ncbi:MAG: hypothetical protein HY721_20150 [Planctomycetes bacterium]|nr:hypothetical protein [Planctomycetota bacterium]
MRRRRTRLAFAALWTALVVTAGLAVNIYLALRGGTIEAHVRAELEEVLEGPFDFSAFELSLSGGAEVRNLRLFAAPAPGTGEAAGHPPPREEVFSAPSVRVYVDLLALLKGSFRIRQVLLDSPTLRVAREPGGRWSFEGLLSGPPRGGAPDGGGLARLPAVLIERGKIVYEDARTFVDKVTETADDVYAHLAGDTDGSLRLKAQLRTAHARKVELTGSVSFSSEGPVLRLQVVARKVDLSFPCERLLPPGIAEEVRKLKVRGFADILGSLKCDAREGLVPIHLSGNLLRCELSPPFSPHPLRGLEGSFVLTERTLEVKDVRGSLGSGKARVSAKIDLKGPWLGPGGLEVASCSMSCGIDSFVLDQRLRDGLPPAARRVLEEYRVQGTVGIDLRVLGARRFPPAAEDVSATVRLEGVDFVYRKFPYLLTDLRGELRVEKGRVSFDRPVEGRDGAIHFSLSGRGAELKEDGAIDVTVKCEDVPLDEKLRSALPVEAQAIWDDFQLLGSGDAVIAVMREAAAGRLPGQEPEKPRVTVAVRPRKVRMSYRGFPYEVRDIEGSIALDTRTGRLTFGELKGSRGAQEITADGVVEIGPGPPERRRGTRFSISLHSPALPVDEDLVAALSEDGRRLLADFNFKGSVKADVKIYSTEDHGTRVDADVGLLEGSVRHRQLPYPLELRGGRIRLSGDQTVLFERIATAEDAKPSLVFDGSLTSSGGTRTLELHFDVKNLRFDDALLDALPAPLESFVAGMKLGGTYRGLLNGSYTFDASDPSDPPRYSVVYEGKDISADDASVDFGIKIHEMRAKGGFRGGVEPGRPHRLLGEVRVESAWFNRLHLTMGEIDFALGREHPVIEMARAGRRIEGREYSPPAAMLERLAGDKVKDTFQMLVHSSDLYGGTVDGFLYVDGGAYRDLAGDFVAQGLQLSRAAGDVFGVAGADAAGTAKGKIQFRGSTGDVLSITGKGEGTIEKAKLVEVPLFLGMLSGLFGEGSSRHFFNEALVRYEIKDGKFRAPSDGIEVRSAGLKLVGGGTMDFSGSLDLNLEPRILDLKIPIVEQIFSLVKKGLAQVWVTGDLAKPHVRLVTGAGIVRIGIDPAQANSTQPLPSDLRDGKGSKDSAGSKDSTGSKDSPASKDLPPGPK